MAANAWPSVSLGVTDKPELTLSVTSAAGCCCSVDTWQHHYRHVEQTAGPSSVTVNNGVVQSLPHVFMACTGINSHFSLFTAGRGL